jgi:pimeloyl-ACP methyl ester carboxylesterase
MTASRKWFRVALVVVLLAVVGYRYFAPHDGAAKKSRPAAAAAPATPRMFGRIAFQPCTLAPPFGGNVEAQCGKLDVAENPAAPNGRHIALNLAWITADDNGEHVDDPIFMLAGGPGQAATTSYPGIAPAFAEALKHRDVMLVDQRGTGGSNPLTCADGDDAATQGDDAAAEQAMRTMATRCLATLSKRADLRFYTTSDAIRDLDAVRAALGLERINLIGISYGTRVAQQYARRYPQRTRTLVLDSVAPNTLFLGNDFARNLESALDLQFGRCGRTPDCAKALGDPRARLNALMAKLRTDPPRVGYRDASTGAWREDTLTAGHIAALTRMYAYSPAAASVLPLMLDEGAKGRYDGLMALSKMLVGDLSEQMAFGMQLSVICSEDADGLKTDPAMAASILGNSLVGTLLAQCELWPKGARPADFHAPLTSDVPALLLAGELDPVTPPAYARDVARTLPHGRVLVLRGQGHNVIGAGCMPKLFARFLDDPRAKSLDAHCLDTLTDTPPFTGFNGWSP